MPFTPSALATPALTKVGTTMNSAVKNSSAPPIVHPIAFEERRSSSGSCRLADQASAR